MPIEDCSWFLFSGTGERLRCIAEGRGLLVGTGNHRDLVCESFQGEQVPRGPLPLPRDLLIHRVTPTGSPLWNMGPAGAGVSPMCCTEQSCGGKLPPKKAEPWKIILCKTSLLPFHCAHVLSLPGIRRNSVNFHGRLSEKGDC